jgi:hypothetical protein
LRRVIVNVLNDEYNETKAQTQRRAFDKFIEAISNSEPLGEDFDEVINEGVHVSEELEL